MHPYRYGADLLERSSTERDLGVLVVNKLAMSQQCALGAKKAHRTLRCITNSMASRSRDPPLLCPGEPTFRLLCPVLGSLVQERQESFRRSPAEDCIDMWGLEHHHMRKG